MKQLNWNTGCGYTKFGQRITATLHSDGVVTFNDHDRGVCGEFTLGEAEFTKSEVMHRYLHNQVRFTSRSHQDAMYEGACNAEYKPEPFADAGDLT